MRVLGELLIQGVMVAVITMTVTKGSIFKWLREGAPEFWSELLSCPYCFAHWASALIATMFTSSPRDWFILWLVQIAISIPIMALLAFSMAQVSIYAGGDDE